jgi:D-beta-D-heptose 7-phosphate kinase/D-beta-D-heptose 1-phosphate adenosyltransferase
LLIGESCVDEYHYGKCTRISPEAPVPVLDFVRKEIKDGMAANVRQNLLSFGMDVDFKTNNPKLIKKIRYVDESSGQSLLREDIEEKIESINLSEIDNKNYDAIVISDYNKGLFFKRDELLLFLKNFSGPKFVDSKSKDLSCFEDCIIKINKSEFERAVKFPKNYELIVTQGNAGARWNNKIIPAPKVEVFDVTGAGDVFLASMCASYLINNNIEQSIKKSIYLASKSVEHRGVYCLTQEDIGKSYYESA